MHLLYLYQFYNTPDCPATARLYSYLRHLAPRHRITLLTTEAYLKQRLTQEYSRAPAGVDVRLLDVPYDNRMGAPRRLVAYASYAVRAMAAGLWGERPDVIVGVSPPLSAAWAASVLARLKRVPWIFEVNDLWPAFPIQMGAVPSPWLQRRLYALEEALYRHAAHVITRSPDMERHVRGCGLPHRRVTTLLNGSDFDLLAPCTPEALGTLRGAYGLTGQRVILYGGTFGRANDLPTLLAAASRLTHRTDARFVFAGYGYYEPLLRDAAARFPNVLLLPPQPRHRMLCWFALADLSLVPFIDRPVLQANSPAKFFDSLAAGTPVLVTNPGWTKRFVDAHACGWYVPPSDPTAMAERIAWILEHPEECAAAGRRGAAAARAQFDRGVLAQQLEAIFERVVARGR